MDDVARWRGNLKGETDGVAIYRAMASAEPDPSLATVYHRLAEAEARHGALWDAKLREAGAWRGDGHAGGSGKRGGQKEMYVLGFATTRTFVLSTGLL